jgi:hypothetical protein
MKNKKENSLKTIKCKNKLLILFGFIIIICLSNLSLGSNDPVWGVIHSIHTTISDGLETPSQRVSNLKAYYNWASTSDHDVEINPSEWNNIRSEANGNDTNNFTYFVGYEWKGVSVGNAEVLAFFVDSAPVTKVNGTDPLYDTFSEFSGWLMNNNGMACINHPSRIGNVVDWNNAGVKNDSYYPCVEMINKQYFHWNDYWNCSSGSGCTTYLNPSSDTSTWSGGVFQALQKGLHLGFVGGWDYHGAIGGSDDYIEPNVYTGLAGVNSTNWTRAGIFDAIRKRHTWASQNKTFMSVSASNGSNNFIMGDIFNFSSSDSNIIINYSINATLGATITNVSLFYNGVIVNMTYSDIQNVSGIFRKSLRNNAEDYLFIEAIQSNGQRAFSSPMYITYSDNVYPSFSNFISNPINSSNYTFAQIYRFNSTVINTNGTVGLEFNGINYTSTYFSNNFTASVTGLSAGTYSYYWWGFGNGDIHNYNLTSMMYYTINKTNSSTSLTFDKTSPQSYPNQIIPTCSIITGVGTPVLQVNGTTITSGNPITLGVGTWTFNCSLASSQNYSYSQNITTFTISQNTTYALNLTFSPSQNLIYSNPSTVTGIGCPSELTCNLSNNVTGFVVNPHIAILGARIYNYTYNTSGNTNYSSKSISGLLTINKSSSLVYTHVNNNRNNVTISNNTAIWLNGTLITGTGTINLYKNGTLINQGSSPIKNYTSFNGTGIYNITTIYSGNENYTGSFETWFVNVTSQSNINISLIYPSNNTISNEGALTFIFNYTGVNADTCTLFIDGIADNLLTYPTVNINQSIQTTLTFGNYTWFIQCYGYGANFVSETRLLSLNQNIFPVVSLGKGISGYSFKSSKIDIKLIPRYYYQGKQILSNPVNNYDSVILEIFATNNNNFNIYNLSIYDIKPSNIKNFFNESTSGLSKNENKLLWSSSMINITSLTNKTIQLAVIGFDDINKYALFGEDVINLDNYSIKQKFDILEFLTDNFIFIIIIDLIIIFLAIKFI